ncbi:Ribosome-recycling factor, mitochondrial [Wickerhamiella sorbophila]|uniref:Ribosome-recycling factor, mitochondrial n=1 Tax=Wickerhamiella sorbophila TaxID=45607 RepID=A0A2T0FDT0_9ASCO|nr:Ribosome-recycling factor, mitochondrial [Wickerhamiella sorbophila]PRT53168.1 Ribosome-recycling factor, mitochondrial [Wickerhamiella sorbophila]
MSARLIFQAARRPVLRGTHLGVAQFSTARAVLKKKERHAGGGKASKVAEEPEIDISALLDIKEVESSLEKTIKAFNDKAKLAKQGSSELQRFTQLSVNLGKTHEQKLNEIATVATRGNKVMIVAFDPKHVKYIQSAVVGQLNMPAEPVATDKQTLAVTIPPNSASKKDSVLRQIKEDFEHFKQSQSHHSIAAIRQKALNPIKKARTQLTADDFRKLNGQVEDVVKQYTQKLTDAFKKAS